MEKVLALREEHGPTWRFFVKLRCKNQQTWIWVLYLLRYTKWYGSSGKGNLRKHAQTKEKHEKVREFRQTNTSLPLSVFGFGASLSTQNRQTHSFATVIQNFNKSPNKKPKETRYLDLIKKNCLQYRSKN